jgi:hypothetical protein
MFTAPADSRVRVLIVHVSEWRASGRLVASFVDGSAVPFRENVATSDAGEGLDRNYTITYSSAKPTQLKITWLVNSPTGNANLSGAALSLAGYSSSESKINVVSDDSTDAADLTAEGTSDWIHWGDLQLVRKRDGGNQISDFTRTMLAAYDQRRSVWSDGTAGSATDPFAETAGINQLDNGFVFKIPVDQHERTLIVHVGGVYSSGELMATLDDGSGYVYSDVAPLGESYDRNYTLSFSASKPATLTVIWKMLAGQGSIFVNSMSLR